MSLAEDCRKVVDGDPTLRDALRAGIVNYRALARYVRPDVARLHGDDVDIEAVTSALRRYGDEIEGRDDVRERTDAVLADSRVSLRGNVVSITATEVGDVDAGTGFLHRVDGDDFATVVTDDTHVEELRDEIAGDVIEESTGLTALTVESPPEIVDAPGVLARMVSRFMAEQINIVDVTSCHTETIIVVDKRDAVTALEALEELIDEAGAG